MDQGSQVKDDPRRDLPSVDRLTRALGDRWPDLPLWASTEAARQAIADARSALGDARSALGDARSALGDARSALGDGHGAQGKGRDSASSLDALIERAGRHAQRLTHPQPTRVVNATGVVLHTNLGRAVLAPGAVRAVAEVAGAYSDLELDRERGGRGDRLARVATLLRLASGAEAAMAVNNNAAAVVLIANTLAHGKEVIVSRGELVEIGGSFRVPEILERAGVRRVEVGTTNRTRVRDYADAIGPETGLLLKVHRSNFEQRGFVEETSLAELVDLGREHSIPVAEDLGSATLVDLRAHGLPPEAFAPPRIASGVDLLCFSGDKLLGGPQAGLILGRAEAMTRLRRNPLARALRLDKLSLAALDWTLRAVLDGRAEEEVPTLRQLVEPLDRVEARARDLAARLARVEWPGLEVEVARDRCAVGGGSLPGFELATWVVRLAGLPSAERCAAALRRASAPVLCRVRDDRVILDARTLLPGDESLCEKALLECQAKQSSRHAPG